MQVVVGEGRYDGTSVGVDHLCAGRIQRVGHLRDGCATRRRVEPDTDVLAAAGTDVGPQDHDVGVHWPYPTERCGVNVSVPRAEVMG